MPSIKGSESLDEWRHFFATAKNSSVFDILDQAITIAATDYPDEFKTQKTRILNSIQGLVGRDQVSNQGSDQGGSSVRKPHIIRIKIPKRYKDQKALMEAKPCSDEPKVINKEAMEEKSMEDKIDAKRKKLHDKYEEFDKAKRQKRIQVLNYVPQQNFKLGCSKPKPQAKRSCLQQKRVVKNPCSQLPRFVSC